jgi:dTMP kinase
MKFKNRFISFEGVDGSGKTLQIKLLTNYFIKHDIKVLNIREPGSTVVGEQIRKILIDKRNAGKICDMTELFLFMAARAQIVCEKIIPELNKKKSVIICDRFIDSSLVYQGIARGIGEKIVNRLNNITTNNLKPDITFFLDISPQEIKSRNIKKNKRSDRLESEDFKFHQKVYFGYKKIFLRKQNIDRVVFINANCSSEIIHKKIISYL